MRLDCPRCNHHLPYDRAPPRFCPNLGAALAPAQPEPTTPANAHDALATVPLTTPSLSGSDRPDSVGTYRLLRTLGRGGMGTVYEAEQVGTGRHVALKLIRPEFAQSPTAVERFPRQGRLPTPLTPPPCL